MGNMGRTDLFCPVSSTYYISQSWIQAQIFAVVQLPGDVRTHIDNMCQLLRWAVKNCYSQTG